MAAKTPKTIADVIKDARAAKARANQLAFELVQFKDGPRNLEFNIDVTSETVWSTQQQMSDLFDVDRSVISKHLKNIFDAKELDEPSVCAEFAHTGPDGKTYQVKHYNLVPGIINPRSGERAAFVGHELWSI